MPMKALTIWQPWATLIIIGAKPFEWREWDYRTRVPGAIHHRIVIHAANRKVNTQEVAVLLHDLGTRRDGSGLDVEKARPLLERAYRNPNCLPLGAGLGTAVIGEPRTAAQVYPDNPRCDASRWGWPMGDPVAFEPIVPCRGAQGFWNWPWVVEVAA